MIREVTFQPTKGVEMPLSPMLIWFLVGLALALLELAVPGIILVFFGLGAWITAITTWIGITPSLWSQLIVFSVSSVLLVLLLRRWLRNRFLGHEKDLRDGTVDLDDFVGKTVMVTKAVAPRSREGRVEFKGAGWTAVSDEALAEGELAVIVAVDGITLRIKKSSGEG
jgi:membrane protein implicated in regulation of membrane protease activity